MWHRHLKKKQKKKSQDLPILSKLDCQKSYGSEISTYRRALNELCNNVRMREACMYIVSAESPPLCTVFQGNVQKQHY